MDTQHSCSCRPPGGDRLTRRPKNGSEQSSPRHRAASPSSAESASRTLYCPELRGPRECRGSGGATGRSGTSRKGPGSRVAGAHRHHGAFVGLRATMRQRDVVFFIVSDPTRPHRTRRRRSAVGHLGTTSAVFDASEAPHSQSRHREASRNAVELAIPTERAVGGGDGTNRLLLSIPEARRRGTGSLGRGSTLAFSQPCWVPAGMTVPRPLKHCPLWSISPA